MKAIIIAAGPGTRLRPYTEAIPKCLVEVAGKPIVRRQMEIFQKFGLKDIALIRGWRKEKVNLSGITYFDNDDFENNNILHSLFHARDFMDGSFISSYSDIVYEEGIVKDLLDHPGEIGIIVDTVWKKKYKGRLKHPVSEAELVLTDRKGRVKRIGKDVVSPDEATGEFIGLAKFFGKGVKILKNEFNRLEEFYKGKEEEPFQHAKKFKKAYLTDMIQELVDRGHEVYGVKIRGGWTEIDTDEDLMNANKFWAKS